MTFKTSTLAELSFGQGSYGIAASAVEFSENLPTYLRITDINDDGTLNKDGLKSVDDPNSKKYSLKPNDIVFARTGASTGRNYFYDGLDGQFVYAGFLIKFSIDPKKIYPLFVKYFCLSKEYRGWVNAHTNGSTRGNINSQVFGSLPITYPADFETQRKIAHVLSTIDDKIALNNKINDNLSLCLYRPSTASSPFKSFGNNASRTRARRLFSRAFLAISCINGPTVISNDSILPFGGKGTSMLKSSCWFKPGCAALAQERV